MNTSNNHTMDLNAKGFNYIQNNMLWSLSSVSYFGLFRFAFVLQLL